MITEATGSDEEITSFVSDKNTNVDAVQFVIQTEAIEMEESVDTEPVVVEKLTFWQKLLRLFGLYWYIAAEELNKFLCCYFSKIPWNARIDLL